MPEIEFVDPDFDSGQDEELVTGPRHAAAPAGHRRAWIGAAVAAAVVVAGAGLVGILHGGGGGHPAAARAFTAVLAPEAPASAFRVDHLGGDAPEGARPGTLAGQTPTPSGSIALVLQPCPNVDACRIDEFVTARVRAVLRDHLPGVRRIEGSSVVVIGRHPTLRFRQVTARDGRLSVRITVRVASARERTSGTSTTVGAGTTVSATAVERGYAVIVTISGPDTESQGIGVNASIAADPRLLAVD